MYSEILVSYDIEDNKQRRKLFEDLKDLGLRPIQKSVFWGYVLVSEKRIIKELLKVYCNEKDKAFFVNANVSKNISDFIGYDPEEFKTPDSFEIL